MSNIPQWLHTRHEPSYDRPEAVPRGGDGSDRATALIVGFCKQHGLSPRESAVVTLLARGVGAKAIGHELNCSLSTTTTHIRRLLRKLACCCQDRYEIAPTLLTLALATPALRCRKRGGRVE